MKRPPASRPAMTTPERHRKRRVLFIAEAVTLAHVTRPLVLAQGLDQDRWDIFFACHPRFDALIGAQPNVCILPIYSIDSERFFDNARSGCPLFDYRTLTRYVRDDLEIIRDIRPDVVVGDFRLSLSVSARVAGVPSVMISNIYYYPHAAQTFPMPELALNRFWGLAVGSAIYHLMRPLAFAVHTIPLNRVRHDYKLPLLGPSLRRTFTDSDRVVYADVPGLGFPEPLRANHSYIGPVLWSPDVALPSWWRDVPRSRPVISVSLGSSGPPRLLPIVLAGLDELAVSVVAATAGRQPPPGLPTNAYVADYLPGDQAAEMADLIVCNGGSPTTYQALAAGKPVLGIPTNLDQHLNMQSVVRTGFGETLRAERVTPSRIRHIVSRLLDNPGYRERAASFSRELSGYRANPRFKLLLESLVEAS